MIICVQYFCRCFLTLFTMLVWWYQSYWAPQVTLLNDAILVTCRMAKSIWFCIVFFKLVSGQCIIYLSLFAHWSCQGVVGSYLLSFQWPQALSMQVSMFSHCQVGVVHTPLLFSTSIPLIWYNCLFIVDGGKVRLIIQGSHWMEGSQHKEVPVTVVKAET